MSPSRVEQRWDHLRQAVGVGLRAVEAIPPDRLHSHPIPGMRTPAELVVHMFSMMRGIALGVTRGEIGTDAGEERRPGVATHAELVRYCRDCWREADAAVHGITDAQLAAAVRTPWGASYSGSLCLGIIHDEFLHHRGQLFAYLRALGAAPPMMWDFANNTPEFQPRAR